MMRMLNMAMVVLLGAQALASAESAAVEHATNAPIAAVSSTSGPADPGIDAFRLIFERNIFNPNRSGRTIDRERDFTRREPERRARRESFALVGTMSYEKGVFAFFDGSSADFKKVLKTSDTIAGFTVASVTPTEVILRSSMEVAVSAAATASNGAPSLETNAPAADAGSTNAGSTNAGSTATVATPTTTTMAGTNQTEITLPVGMQLQRFDEGRWELSARSSPDGGRSSAASASSAIATSSPGGGNEEVLKRLMQQREQESGGGGGSSAPGSAPAVEAPVTAPVPAPAPSAGGSEDEVLRRLMQRREQEK